MNSKAQAKLRENVVTWHKFMFAVRRKRHSKSLSYVK